MTAVQDTAAMNPPRDLARMFIWTLLSGVACGAVGWFLGFIGRG